MFDQMKAIKALSSLMANRDELKARFEQLQTELGQKEVSADAGAGAVRVTVSGKLEVRRVELDPAVIATLTGDDAEENRLLIEELIVGATNAAMQRAQEMAREEMSKMAGGVNLPGLDTMLGGA
jgi:DNA-binding YbaB/EbfC family protein